MLVSYYSVPAVREWLDVLGRAKDRHGWFFVIGGSIFAGAIFPQTLKILILQRGKITPRNWYDLRFLIIFWLFMGVTVDILYTTQGRWFGHGNDWQTIAKKVLFDQFVYCPFFANIVTVVVFELHERRWDFSALREMRTWRFWRTRHFPLMIATWAVWIPIVSIVYAMPRDLQFPVFSLVLSFWSLMMAMIASGK